MAAGFAVEIEVGGVHLFKGEVIVVGGGGVVCEDLSAGLVVVELTDCFSHRGGIAYWGVETAVGVAHDFGHASYVCHERGEAGGHGLKEGHGQTLGDR